MEGVLGDESGRPHFETSCSSTHFRHSRSWSERMREVSLRTLPWEGVLAVRWEMSEAKLMAVVERVMANSGKRLISLKVWRPEAATSAIEEV